MADYAYWVADGRPVIPALPVRETVERFEARYPGAKPILGWYTNDAHLKAATPEDHTPFSETGWPVPNPYPYVCATDLMPYSAYDLDEVFAYWLAEARAGRTPWVKYLIYKDRIYTIWRGFVADVYRGAYHNHIHMSVLTTWVDRSIGSWSPIPEGNDMDPAVEYAVNRRLASITAMSTTFRVSPEVSMPNQLTIALRELAAKVDLIAKSAGTDPDELAAITAAAREGAEAGVLASADELIAAVVAGLPAGALTPADVEAALRAVLIAGVDPSAGE
jgi:hypothetical protein